jgi:hypothetical protein
MFGQHVGQADTLLAEHLASDHGVEETANLHAEIAVQAANIVIRGVENLANGGIGKNRRQRRQVFYGQRVDQHRPRRGGDLQQTDLFLVGMQGVRFEIDGYDRFRPQVPHQPDYGRVIRQDGGQRHENSLVVCVNQRCAPDGPAGPMGQMPGKTCAAWGSCEIDNARGFSLKANQGPFYVNRAAAGRQVAAA